MAMEAEKKAKDAAALQKEVGTVLQGVTTVVYNKTNSRLHDPSLIPRHFLMSLSPSPPRPSARGC